jgi:hypothetical protein
MEEKIPDKPKRARKLLRGTPMMIIALLVVLIGVPMSFMMGGKFVDFLKTTGMKKTPNIDGGYLIAEFPDPADDLLRTVPDGALFQDAGRALDILRFSVKKVRFHPMAGAGIAPRLNLVFEFDGKLPNPHYSDQKFSSATIHVYIDAPDKSSTGGSSDMVIPVSFSGGEWDYQVIIDGMHEQARIFDRKGNLLGKGLGLYVNYDGDQPEVFGDGVVENVTGTHVTAALPLKMIGDPSEGEWSYYVAIGLVDVSNPTMMLPPQNITDPPIFDCILPDGSGTVEIGTKGKIVLKPLQTKKS